MQVPWMVCDTVVRHGMIDLFTYIWAVRCSKGSIGRRIYAMHPMEAELGNVEGPRAEVNITRFGGLMNQHTCPMDPHNL